MVNLVAVSGNLDDDSTTPEPIFVANALDNSAVGERARLTVANSSGSTFDLTVEQLEPAPSTTAIVTEPYTDLTLSSAATIVNRDSRLIRLTRVDPTGTTLPGRHSDSCCTYNYGHTRHKW
ncbi:MAG: hypothetical protein R2867_26145 [Caldilineaceae bacterium]